MKAALPRSLRAKLVGVVLLTTMAAVAVALIAMVAYDLRTYHQAWISDMNTQAELLGHATAPALEFDDRKVAQQNLALLHLRPQVRAAAIYGVHGELFASYAADPAEEHYPKTPEGNGVHISQGEVVVFKRVIEHGEILGTVYLRAAYELWERVLSYAGIALAVALLAMLVAFLVSLWLQRIVTRPILAIGTIAREVIEQRDYSRRAQKLSDDEVGALSESFNDMMAEIERRSHENEASIRQLAHEMDERRGAQQEVMRLNQQLELRVQERTMQLEASNRELALATQAAEQANRAKSEFLSSMSHELRTPLNAILGFGQLLLSARIDSEPAKRSQYTRHILKAGGHLLTLINEILDLARIESSNLMLSLEPVALGDVMRECRTMIEPAANLRGIRTLFPEDIALSVLADRTRLKQVLLNLLSNAVKYNRESGAVVVDCSASVTPERVRISVQDTGAGLQPSQLAALFQPFNRLGQEAGSEEGTGIGLVVTKRLVELMGGAIGVTSTVGIGSVFWIELNAAEHSPIAAADTAPAPLRDHAAPSDAALPTLLYVEDNPANLKLVEEIVGYRGDLRQLSAPDAQLGIDLARAHLPQVILMDINLPGLKGTDAYAILRSHPATAHIPVIALTANAMPRDIAHGLSMGFFRYITKPIDVANLNEAIDSALEFSRRQRDEMP